MSQGSDSGPRSESGRARELTKGETRDALLAAGLAAFAEEGLDAPSLDSICARAGFTRGAFYVHFKDRDDFLIAVMEGVLQTFLDTIIATSGSATDLTRTIDTFASAVDGGALPLENGVRLHQFLAACAKSEAIRERYVAVLHEAARRLRSAIEEAQRAKTVRGDVSSESVATILIAVALGVHNTVELGYGFEAKRLAEVVLRLVTPQA